MVDINNLAEKLNHIGKDQMRAIGFDVQPIPGDVEVLQITIDDREELPVYLSIADDQILCMAYLFTSNEVNENNIAEMHDYMLSMNVPMPLSSFAKIDNQYVVFGALSVNATIEDIVHEIEVLSDNSLEAIDAMKSFLN